MSARNLLALFVLALPTVSYGQSLVDQAEKDELYIAADGDQNMQAAYRQAREGLEGFLSTWRKPPPGLTDFAVKVGVTEGADTEYFWVSLIREDAGSFTGTINNEPRWVTTVELGQEIGFRKAQIVDWIYLDQGRMVGNFTACAMLKDQPESERLGFEQRFGLRCEYP